MSILHVTVVMQPAKHVRLEGGAARSDLIRAFVWPALMHGQRCVFRAVVLT